MTDLGEFVTALTAVPAGGTAGLAVDADLRLELTTAAGESTTARVTGHGQRVRVEAERPEVFLAAVSRTDVGRAADLLAAAGIAVEVHGPRGPLAALGAGTSDRFGRAVTGSNRVALAPRGAAWLVAGSRQVRVIAGTLLVVLGALAAVGSLRRRAGLDGRGA